MQPYLYPYAGYFRLLAEADVFVVYDCVQFPQRGRVHRCEVPGPAGAIEWLTLPLARRKRETRICDLAFAPGARDEFDRRLARLPWLTAGRGEAASAVRSHLHAPLESVVGYLEDGLRLVAGMLELHCSIVRSSGLAIDAARRGQDRIIAICRELGASEYINAPGGSALYDAGAFAAAGLTLEFLPDYRGRYRYLLPALLAESLEALQQDVHSPGAATESGPTSVLREPAARAADPSMEA